MTANPVFADSATLEPMKVVGEDVFFLVDHSQTGNYEIYLHNGPEGAGPVHHSHPWDEAFYVIQGTVDFVAGDVKKTLGPGELVHIPAGMRHSFKYVTPVQILSISTTDGAKKLFEKLTRLVPHKVDGLTHAQLEELKKGVSEGLGNVEVH